MKMLTPDFSFEAGAAPMSASLRHCRSCASELEVRLVDLGMQPLSNAYRRPHEIDMPETTYPLTVYVCIICHLVQIDAVERREEIFSDNYAYFSSYSSTWLAHAEKYAERMIAERRLTSASLVVEVASNDGYLLRHFISRGISAHGIDPAADCAAAAKLVGVETTVDFFGVESARRLVERLGKADLIVANNVLAHVPDLNDFVAGFATLLAPDGVITFEFPHLLQLFDRVAFDTIYHEHYSYLSVIAVTPLFERHGLQVVEVEPLTTHGGSLRIHVAHLGASMPGASVDAALALERSAGLGHEAVYHRFAKRVAAARYAFIEFLIHEKRSGRSVAAYGAAAKGNTLLNSCGIRRDLISFVVDRNPHKVGCLMPGSQIPILPVERLNVERPDTIVILPWNLVGEIREQLRFVEDWGAALVVAIPQVRVLGKHDAFS